MTPATAPEEGQRTYVPPAIVRDADEPVAHLTDVGNAMRLVAAFGDEIRYSPGWGWLVWDGRRWLPDALSRVQELVKQSARLLYAAAMQERAKIAGQMTGASEEQEHRLKEQDKRAAGMAKWALTSEDARRVTACLKMALSDPKVAQPTTAFDADPLAFNCANGTIDLRTGLLRPHDRADLITKVSPVAYDRDADAPVFGQFLADVFLGDAELMNWLQRWCGYCLSGSVQEQAFSVFWGDGSNGKGTLCELMLALFGDYGHKAEVEMFLASNQDRHSTERADLCGKRFVLASESGEGRRLNESLIKELTGGDSVSARHLYQDAFTFPPTWKINLLTNHKPHIRGTDHAIWRRPRLVPFKATFAKPDEPEAPGSKPADPELPNRIRSEMPGVLAWMVRGSMEWRSAGLGVAKAIQDAMKEYRAEEDYVAQFVAERVVLDQYGKVKGGEAYKAYRAWHEERGHDGKPMSNTMFGRRLTKSLEAKGVTKDVHRAVYSGMRIVNPIDDQLFE